jgi:hypothetical protein
VQRNIAMSDLPSWAVKLLYEPSTVLFWHHYQYLRYSLLSYYLTDTVKVLGGVALYLGFVLYYRMAALLSLR